MPAKKSSGSNRALLFFLVLILGAAAGWFFAPPDQQEKVQGVVRQAKRDLPGLVKNFLRTMPQLYDEYVPSEYRDTLSEGLPAIFAYPYVCRVDRVYNAATGVASPALGIPVRQDGYNFELRTDGIIRPGLILLATNPQLAVDVECRNLKIHVGAGTQVKFLRGKDSQKVLEVRGNAVFQAMGPTQLGFAMPWGTVGLAFGETPGQARYRLNGAQPLLELLAGDAEVSWVAESPQASNQELFQLLANPSARVRIRHTLNGTETVRDIGPQRQASFLANGQVSGAIGAFRGGNAPPSGGPSAFPAAPLGSNSDVAAPAPSGMDGAPGLTIVNPNILMKTEGATIDVMLEWRLNPGNRVVPCNIEMAADPQMQRILATYKSSDMRLMLKGMRPGIYYWRVGCDVVGSPMKTNVAKVQVQDGRRSAPIPILLSPPNKARVTGGAVTYTWEKVDGATQYVLELSRDPKFTKSNEYLVKQGTGIRMNLKKRGTYYWRVYGVTGDTKDKRTGFSAISSFTF